MDTQVAATQQQHTATNALEPSPQEATMQTNLDAFTRAYIECALWSSTDEQGTPLDDDYDIDDLSPSLRAQMVGDCIDFQNLNAADLLIAHALGETAGQAGHDFWLTRNHHGAGFWDRGLGDVGERLTRNAHAYGSQDLYVGDDGLIYGSN